MKKIIPINNQEYERLITKEDQHHERIRKRLILQLKKFQESCDHPNDELIFNGDPTDRNFSYYWCSICGKCF